MRPATALGVHLREKTCIGEQSDECNMDQLLVLHAKSAAAWCQNSLSSRPSCTALQQKRSPVCKAEAMNRECWIKGQPERM
eukprot:3233389-Rhodomonas_salina.2